MLYNPPSGSTDPNASYIGKNIAAGTQGSKVPPAAVETTQREIVNVIISAGLNPTNADLTQLLQAINAVAANRSTTIINAKSIIGGRVLFSKIAAGTYSWICPADTTRVRIRAIAGGGGGGGGNGYAGAGGLGGNYFEGVFAVSPGVTYTIVVGAGGIAGGGGGGGQPGGNGGSTYIQLGGGVTPIALGGTGGGSGGNASTSYVGIAGQGAGYSGISFPYGGFEILGFAASNGIYITNPTLAITGIGGGSYLASSTPIGVQNGAFNGSGNGGGGGGGVGSSGGGVGASGALFIEG